MMTELNTAESTCRDLEEFEQMMENRDPEDFNPEDVHDTKLTHAHLVLEHWRAVQYEASINPNPMPQTWQTKRPEDLTIQELGARVFELQVKEAIEFIERDAAREERQEESDQCLEDLDVNDWLLMREGLL
jgi:hypothetical protein